MARWQARPGLELEGTRLARSRGAALQQLRGGDVATGLAAYANAGRVVTRDTADAQRAANVARWWPAAQAGDPAQAVMLAHRRADVDDSTAGPATSS